jgi:hypothetical protein
MTSRRLPDHYEPGEVQVLGEVVLVQQLALIDMLHGVGKMLATAPMSPHAGRWRKLQGALQTAYNNAAISRERNNEFACGANALTSEACEDDLITVAEASQLLGIGVRRVQQLASHAGGRKVGGRWLFDRGAVLALKHLRQNGIEEK